MQTRSLSFQWKSKVTMMSSVACSTMNSISIHKLRGLLNPLEIHKSFLWHVHYGMHTHSRTCSGAHAQRVVIHSQKTWTGRPHKHSRWQSQTNILCGGSNYVKWLVLITFLCLRGDYEHINQQHSCQLEASDAASRRDGGKRAARRKRLEGIKLDFFFFLVTLKQI